MNPEKTNRPKPTPSPPKKNKISAFPRNGHPDRGDYPVSGMSLHDYFKAKAMQGILSGIYSSPETIKTMSELAKSRGISLVELVTESSNSYAECMISEQ